MYKPLILTCLLMAFAANACHADLIATEMATDQATSTRELAAQLCDQAPPSSLTLAEEVVLELQSAIHHQNPVLKKLQLDPVELSMQQLCQWIHLDFYDSQSEVVFQPLTWNDDAQQSLTSSQNPRSTFIAGATLLPIHSKRKLRSFLR